MKKSIETWEDVANVAFHRTINDYWEEYSTGIIRANSLQDKFRAHIKKIARDNNIKI
ncbi:hypothetical protein LCGC14_0900900 [marine sediment metagenome]|uniref:Uncharacterized protein n=1 Tax=marine sediment metagenome TaxID=412755 RepID=A0A0F9P1E7_9ZZZZ